jgi:hypothetical protein
MAPPVSTHAMVAAMAGMGAGPAGNVHTMDEPWRASRSMLTAPRIQIA